MTEIRHAVTVTRRRGWREARLDTYGEAFEDFLSTVYITAIRLGTPTRESLRSADLDDDEITAATGEMVARGLLSATDDPDTWRVVPPREALVRYADTVQRRAETSRTAAAELEALWRRALGDRPTLAPSDLEMVAGVEAVIDRIVALHRSATERLWWAIDASPAARQLLREVADHPDRLAVRPGVQRHVALDTLLLDEPSAMSFVEHLRAEGHPVAFGHGVPFSVLVADSSSVVVDLTAFDRTEGSFEVRLRPPVEALIRLFQAIWTLATPYWPGLLEAPRTPDRLPLAERDQRILALLTTGASDQVIARQMAVSVRTVERRVRYLMDRLGAATRFQAGVQAARRGWL